VSDSYRGATEEELLGAPLARRVSAGSDQWRLLPRQRPPQLAPRTLVLGGWRVIRSEAVANVRLTLTDAYRRSQAAGIRGNNARFGLFAGLGEPLVPDLHDEHVSLLIGFRWFTGINQAGRWTPVLCACPVRRCPHHETKAYRRIHPGRTDRRPRHRAHRPARLGSAAGR
jgi:hypothetical protein